MITALIVLAVTAGAWCALRVAREEAAALYGIALLARGTVLEFDEGKKR